MTAKQAASTGFVGPEWMSVTALPGAGLGAVVGVSPEMDAASLVSALEGVPEALPQALCASHGLLLLPDMHRIRDEPSLLLRLSHLFGDEVEDYRHTLTAPELVHAQVPEIFVVSNLPPHNLQPPARPQPPLTPEGSLPVRFPHRRGWHTDQSYRRPPPDVSLFFAAIAAPPGQGQTLYADCVAAYEALPEALKARADTLVGIHARPGIGRSEQAVRAGDTPMTLADHERPQRQNVVRVHPVTGQRALYLCEAGQMDWIDGPFVDMESGPDGEGAQVLYALMSHITRPEFTYCHEWSDGDLVIYDNRSTLHCATWFDAGKYPRLMWRTTVRGNPGPEFAGERRSWIPAA